MHALGEYGLMHVKLYEDIARFGHIATSVCLSGQGETSDVITCLLPQNLIIRRWISRSAATVRRGA